MKEHLTKLKTNQERVEKMEKIKQNEQSKKNSNKGITLIALVITIIVLLILAAVSIATLTGENGMLTKANAAKENTEIAEEKELIKLAVASAITKNNGGLLEDDLFKNELDVYIKQGSHRDYILTLPSGEIASITETILLAKIQEEGYYTITYVDTNRSYKVDKYGKIEAIETDSGNTGEESSNIEVSVKTTTEPYKNDLYSVKQELNYEITITNNGSETEKDIKIESTITDYDGQKKSPTNFGNENIEYTNEGFINIPELEPEESKTFTATWKAEKGGKITNTVIVSKTSTNSIATDSVDLIVTEGYNGVEIKLPTQTVKYDGKEQKLAPEVTDVNGNKLVEGEDYTVDYIGDLINVGKVQAKITGLNPYYSINPEDLECGAGGIIIQEYDIIQREITIISGSDSKVWDTEPLICHEYEITGDGLAEGDAIDVVFSGIQTRVGSTYNSFDFSFIKGNSSNYIVNCTFGTLVITPLI